jgi:hypothetical protein
MLESVRLPALLPSTYLALGYMQSGVMSGVTVTFIQVSALQLSLIPSTVAPPWRPRINQRQGFEALSNAIVTRLLHLLTT